MRLAPLPCLLAVAALAGCGVPQAAAPTPRPPAAAVRTVSTQLSADTPCEARFVPRNLRVSTGVRMREIRTYASNGAGLAAGDLDRDGDLDLVLASVDRESTILWNEGGLDFAAEPLDDSFTRGAAIVDVDGDGLLDIAFTHRGTAGVSLWRNHGGDRPRFVQAELPGVDRFAYTMAWADLGGDGQLDLVTGAYDAELTDHGVPAGEIAARGGVALYQQQDGRFRPRQLASRAESLSIALPDLDGDGRRDIWVGNDFDLPDGVWINGGGAWRPALPTSATTENTMSLDLGDVDNDGDQEIFATDMKPLVRDPATLAEWLPMMQGMARPLTASDPQRPENTLLVRSPDGLWYNQGYERGVDASGWSWSGRFGDLDGDGFLDLYVVNGMIASNLFPHLPNGELVEQNRVFRNRGDGTFAPAPEWGLGSTASGRGMLMADMDGDGDLDIVVNNLRSSAQLFENRLCDGESLLVDVRWPGSGNSQAIGAEIELHTSAGVQLRDIRTTAGYLSGDAPRAHFGLPPGATLERLVIRFPDGAQTMVDRLRPHTLVEVTRCDSGCP